MKFTFKEMPGLVYTLDMLNTDEIFTFADELISSVNDVNVNKERDFSKIDVYMRTDSPTDILNLKYGEIIPIKDEYIDLSTKPIIRLNADITIYQEEESRCYY